MTDLEIYMRLEELADADQAERKSNTISSENDAARARELNEIIQQVGWPTISRFGERTCWNA